MLVKKHFYWLGKYFGEDEKAWYRWTNFGIVGKIMLQLNKFVTGRNDLLKICYYQDRIYSGAPLPAF